MKVRSYKAQSYWSLIICIFLNLGCNALLENDSRTGRPDISKIGRTTDDQTDLLSNDLVRPNNQVFIQDNYCVCLEGKTDGLGEHCGEFCKDRSDLTPTLYMNFNLGPEIELNSIFSLDAKENRKGQLFGWCFNEIPDGNINPSCVIEAIDENDNVVELNANVSTRNNSLTANAINLIYQKTYRIRLTEVTSGASSDIKQVYRKKAGDPLPPSTPLTTVPIHMYTCIDTAKEGNNVIAAVEEYFTYPHYRKPPIVPPFSNVSGVPPIYCHDIGAHGNLDNILFPRLKLINNHLDLWDNTDPRFHDIDKNDKLDYEDQMLERLSQAPYELIFPDMNLFSEFKWPSFPFDNNPLSQGMFLSTIVDGQTGETFCPNNLHYNKFDPAAPTNKDAILEVLGQTIGIETEAAYIGLREDKVFYDQEGRVIAAPKAYVLIRESQAKEIWFYMDSTGRIIPADKAATERETIHFFWPRCIGNGCSPYLRQAHQNIVTIRSPEFLFENNSGNFGLRTSVRPKDKRFGCIPKK